MNSYAYTVKWEDGYEWYEKYGRKQYLSKHLPGGGGLSRETCHFAQYVSESRFE
jgi:hypothetical protein